MKAAFFALFLALGVASAQLPTTDLHQISPFSAKAGATVEVSVSGSNLDALTGLHFTDSRITAEPVRKPAEEFLPNPPPVPNRFQITVGADVPPGIHEVRAVGHFGLSTARPFFVAAADSNEIAEDGKNSSAETAMELPLGAFVNGRIDAKAIDWFRFAAKKGQKLGIRVWAERLDSKLDAQLTIYADGRELQRCKFGEGRDPVTHFMAPADGEYRLAVSDVLFRGGGQFFYRLQIAETPHIAFVFPPAGEPGKRAKFTVFGHHLPGGTWNAALKLETAEVEIDVPAQAAAPVVFSGSKPSQATLRGFDYRLGGSNPYRIGFATAPVVVEDPKAASQTVSAPCEIAGRFDEGRDFDVFHFKGEAGKTYWLDVVCDRLKAPADPFIFVEKLGGEAPVRVAENDERRSYFSVDQLDATNLDSNDPALSFTADADADGEFQVTIVNQFATGGADHLYRLAIREATPDFELFALYERPLANGRAGWPATPVLRKGGTVALRIVAPRQDGFDGEITVTASGLPKGVSAHPLKMSGKVDEGLLIFSAAQNAENWAGPIEITGRAKIGEAEVTRQARSTALVWGVVFADAFRVRTKLDLETVLSVCGADTAPVEIATAGSQTEWSVEIGQKLEIPVKVTNLAGRKGSLTVQPEGLFGMLRSPPTASIAADATEGALTINFTKNGNFAVEPGTYQFSLQGTGIASYRINPQAVDRTNAEVKRIETLAAKLATESNEAKSAKDAAKSSHDRAKKEAAAASAEAKAELQKRAAEAKQNLDQATKAVAEIEAKSKRAAQLQKEAQKRAKDAENRAKPKDEKFAAYSVPLTVVVKPKPEKK